MNKKNARCKGNIQSRFQKELEKELSKIKNSVSTRNLNLELSDGVLDISSIKSVGVSGSSLISTGDGKIEWNTSISAKQRDVFLVREDTEYKFNSTEDIELVFPPYRDGCFSLEEKEIVISIDIRIYYKYTNSKAHLPFYLKAKKNEEIVYVENFGDYDDYSKNQKLNESIVITAKNTDVIKILIRKKFDDDGDFLLLKNSFMTFEVL